MGCAISVLTSPKNSFITGNPTKPMIDLALILTFAWTGLLFGFMSLWDIEVLLEKFFNRKFIPVISSFLLFLSSFGIYLGRYLRWNSWDIIQKPYSLVYDIGHRVVNPLEHPRTWGMTIFMGVFLNLMYWSLRLIDQRTKSMGRD